ncbi:MAG: hypothetical protein AB1500_07715 [Bacillota bacterium]
MAKRRKTSIDGFETYPGNPGNFISLYFKMIDSLAWQQLTARDIQLYIMLRRKYQRKVVKGKVEQSNKNDISMPKSEYLKVMNQRMFEKSIDHLIELGFVYLVENNYAERKCNIYGLSDYWTLYGKPEFNVKPEHRRTLKQRIEAEENES